MTLILVSTEIGLQDFSRAAILPKEQATRPQHALPYVVTKSVFSSHIASSLSSLKIYKCARGEMGASGGMRATAKPPKSAQCVGALSDGWMVCRPGKNIRELEGWRGCGTCHPDGEYL